MCGIAAFNSKHNIPLKDMRVVLDEIGVRGIHSTGVSWFEKKVKTKIESKPYYEFDIPETESTTAIFHTRYSTSNLEYPQPVFNEYGALAHNGVVTQAPFETWNDSYGYEGDNQCDSILLLESDEPFEDFPDSSMAVCEIDQKGTLLFYRNGQRPLYYIEHVDFLVVGSTKRSIEYFGMPKTCMPGAMYLVQDGELEHIVQPKSFKDWQI